MPTGYTEKIYNGETTFEEYAWRCARAFGALAHLRDSCLDSKIPLDGGQDMSFYRKSVVQRRAEMEALAAMSAEQAAERAAESNKKAVDTWNAMVKNATEIGERYQAMLDKVQAWTPPTEEHVKLKELMISQIKESIEWDCHHPGAYPLPVTGPEWHMHAMRNALASLRYEEESLARVEAAHKERVEWIDALVQSIGTPPQNDR